MTSYIHHSELPNWNTAHHGMFSRLAKDIGPHIFSYLTTTEKSKASLVCRYWKDLLQPRLVEMIEGVDFNQHRIIYSSSQDASSLLVVSKTRAFVFFKTLPCALLEFGQSYELVQLSCENFCDCHEILDQTDKLLFFKNEVIYGKFNKVSCVRKEDGKILFTLSAGDRIASSLDPNCSQKINQMVQLAIVQKDPLRFLVVDICGGITSISFEDDQLKWNDFWRPIGNNFEDVYYVKNNELLVQFKKRGICKFSLCNIVTKNERELDIQGASLLNEKLLIFKQCSGNKNVISRYGIENQEIKLKYQLLLGEGKPLVSGNLLIFIEFNAIKFINAKNGKELFSLYLRNHPFADCFLFDNALKARLFGNKLILMSGCNWLLVDLNSHKHIHKKFEKPLSLLDFSLRGDALYFVYAYNNRSNLAVLDLSKLKENFNPSSKTRSVIYQVKLPSELFKDPIHEKPLEIIPPPSKNQPLQKMEQEENTTLTLSSTPLSTSAQVNSASDLSRETIHQKPLESIPTLTKNQPIQKTEVEEKPTLAIASKPLTVSLEVNPAPDLLKETIDQKPLERVSSADKKQTLQKIASIVLPILTLLLASISVYFGIIRSINLSIGLGIASAFTGAGSLALKLKQKNTT